MATGRGAGKYSPLAKIEDPTLRASLKLLLDRIVVLEGQARGIGAVSKPLSTHLNAGGNLIQQVQDPIDPTDAVNLQTLQQYVESVVTGTLTAPKPRPLPTPPATPGNPNPPPNPQPPPPTPPPGPTPGPVPPPPPPGTWLPPQEVTGNIRISGRTFRNPDGSIYPWKSASDFRLLQYHYDGTDISPILADRLGEGANMVRVFGMYSGSIGVFDPSAYPNYYVNLPGFADLLASTGLNLELTVFADAQNLPNFNELSEQRAHLLRVRDALISRSNVVLELCNEPFQNGVTPSSHTRPVGLLSSAGSGQDETPDLPPWDYAGFHAPRDAEWPRKAHNAKDIADYLGRPVINDEPMGAAEAAIPGSRSDVPNDFYYFAATGMLLAGGGTFHSSNGVQSQIWQPTTRLCAQSFYGGLNAIPLDITTGTYTRGPLSDCPIQHTDALALRTYARYNATTAVCVVVRPAAGWVAIAQGGWTIDSQTGPSGCVVFLSR